MRKNRAVMFCLLATGLGALGVGLSRRAPAVRNGGASQELTRPEAPAATLATAAPHAPRALVHKRPSLRGTPIARPTGASPPDPASKVDSRSLGALAAAWEKEEEDAEWTLNVQTVIDGLLDTLDAGPNRDVTVRCRRTVCRVDSAMTEQDKLQKVAEFAREEDIDLQTQMSHRDGGLAFATYLGRGGGT